MRFVWLAGLCLGVCATSAAQAPQTKTDAEIKSEAVDADALYQKQNFVAALPLYEDLHAQQPQSLAYQERLAMTLLGGSGAQTPEQALAARKRAKQLLLQAKAAGDNSNLVQVLLEKLGDPDNSGPAAPPPAGHELFDKAEAAFSRGDLPAAIELYKKTLEVNPQYYSAAVFAGDAEYKLNHPAEAGLWFAKAIAIDPNIETAHRYWGDCLDKAGEHQRAESQFIEAIIAEPYTRTPRVGLNQWADHNHARVAPPPITLPRRAEPGKNGNTTITLDGSKKNDPEMGLAMMYSMNSALWQGEKFKKNFPNEKQYRHSLAEETDNIKGMLTVARETKIPESKLSTSTKLLMELEKNDMLECYILLDNPDNGVAQDYAAYRKDHRALMAEYIAKYDVHPM
jgi:tetratricopeptide (TPR) repeat protein